MNINNEGVIKTRRNCSQLSTQLFQMKTLIIVSIITFQKYVTEYDDDDVE